MPARFQNGVDILKKTRNGRTSSFQTHNWNEASFELRISPRKRLLAKQNFTLAIPKTRNVQPGKRLRVEEDDDSDPPITKHLTSLNPQDAVTANFINGTPCSSPKRSSRNTNRGNRTEVSLEGFTSNGSATKAQVHSYADCFKSEEMKSVPADLPIVLKYPSWSKFTDFVESERVSKQSDEEIRKLDEEMKEVIDMAKRKRKISFSHRPKSELFAKKLVAAIGKLPSKMSLKKLKLRNCVTTNVLEIFSRGIDSRKIQSLDLSGNKNLDLRVVESLRNKIQSEVLDLSDTELDAKEIAKLGEMKKLKELRLNYKAFKHGSIAAALVKLINNGLQVLSLVDSKITERQLQKIAKGIKDRVSLRVLDLSHTILKKGGVNAVAKIVNKSKGMDKLVLSNCAISTTILKSFEKFVEDNDKITELDLSSNPFLANGRLHVLSSLADKVNCQALDISSISLDGNKIRELLKTTTPQQLKKLSMAENPDIDFVAVGELVTQWRISDLDVSECRPSSEAIVNLEDSIVGHKLDSIDISDPMGTVNGEKRKALQALSRKTKNLIFGNHQEWP